MLRWRGGSQRQDVWKADSAARTAVSTVERLAGMREVMIEPVAGLWIGNAEVSSWEVSDNRRVSVDGYNGAIVVGLLIEITCKYIYLHINP